VNLLIFAGVESADLWKWLDREDELRGSLTTAPQETLPESMAVEMVIAAAVTAVAAVARSLCRYLEVRERHRGTDLELTITRPNGQTEHVIIKRGMDPDQITGLLGGSPPREP
jgi:hypothetical protein